MHPNEVHSISDRADVVFRYHRCNQRGGYTKLANPPLNDSNARIWIVEKEGRPFARLEDARFVDMFWVGYRVVDLTQTEDDRRRLFSASFWLDNPLPTFRHQATGIVCDTAFAGAGVLPTPESPLVVIRALYPPERKLGFWQRLQRSVFGKDG